MAESKSHKRAKGAAAGRSGKTEVSISRRRRLDAVSASGKRATEIERSGSIQALRAAAFRLRARRSSQKILQVPQSDMSKASQAMKTAKVRGTVKNITGTKRRSV